MRSPFRTLIEQVAGRVDISPDLIEAVTVVESRGNQFAWNPEPRYRYLWDVRRQRPFRPVTAAELASKFPPQDFPSLAGDPDQEWWAQQASFGLMQVMGAVARERGYRHPYLTSLCDPAANISIGAEYLHALLVWAGGDVTQALAAWNGGKGGNEAPPFRNQAYASKVLAQLEQLATV